MNPNLKEKMFWVWGMVLGGGGGGGGVVGVAKENFFYYDFKFKIKKNRVGRRGQGGMARVKVIFYSESKS